MFIGLYPIGDDGPPIGALQDGDETYVDAGVSAFLQDPEIIIRYLAILSFFLISTEGETEFPAVIGEYPFGEVFGPTSEDALDAEIFLSSSQFETDSDDSVPSRIFEPRMVQPFTYQNSIGEPGAFASPRGTLSGGLSFNIGDRALDSNLLANALTGRDVKIYVGGRIFAGRVGDRELSFDEYDTLFKGKAAGFSWDENEASVSLGDVSILLDEPVQTTFYAGTGGLEGGAELEGKPKPLGFGQVFNAPAVAVDTANLIYQVNDGAVSSIDAVRDNGEALVFDTDVADITTASPGLGEYATSIAQGMIKVGGTPEGTLTVDFSGDSGGVGYYENAAKLAEKIVRDKGGFLDDQIDSKSVTDLNTDRPYPCGFYTGTREISISQIIDQLMYSIDSWWNISRTGKFTVGGYVDPGNEIASVSIDETRRDTETFQRIATRDPVWRISIGYQKNWAIQDADGLAAAVSASNKLLYSSDFQRKTAESTVTKSIFPKARDVSYDTLLADSDDASDLAAAMINRYKKRRDILAFSVLNLLHQMAIGQVAAIDFSDLGISENMFIMGVSEDAAARATELTLWG